MRGVKLTAKQEAIAKAEKNYGYFALIYLAYIDTLMRERNLSHDYNLQELLDELDIIERFEHSGKKHHLGKVTKKQLDLYRLLEVEPPA